MFVDKKKKDSVEIPTSSLADIAFLLLVFFLVTTTIATDKGISLALPPKSDTQLEVNKDILTNISINASGMVMMDEEVIDVNLIAERVRQMLQQKPNMIFSVKTLRDTKYDVYIDVLDQLKQANAKKISIAEPEY